MLIDEAFRRFLGTNCPSFQNRIYANVLPTGVNAWPTLTVGEVSGYGGITQSGPDGCGEIRFQTVSWHTTKIGSENAGQEVKVACHGARGLFGGAGGVTVKSCIHKSRMDGYQPEMKLYARINDFEVRFDE